MADRSQEMLCRALEMTEQCLQFYRQSLGACGEGPGREVFSRLLEDERRHHDRVRSIHSAITEGKSWSEACTLSEADSPAARKLTDIVPGPGQASACATEMGAIGSALETEKARVDFYEQWLSQAEDPTEKRFVERMVQEARGHFILLNDLQYFYEDPRGWSLKEDHQILDGA